MWFCCLNQQPRSSAPFVDWRWGDGDGGGSGSGQSLAQALVRQQSVLGRLQLVPGARGSLQLLLTLHSGSRPTAAQGQLRRQPPTQCRLAYYFKKLFVNGARNHNLCCVFFSLILPNLHDLHLLLDYLSYLTILLVIILLVFTILLVIIIVE